MEISDSDEFYKVVDDKQIPLSKGEFLNIQVKGSDTSHLYAKIAAGGWLFDDEFVFIDTLGISSIDELDEKTTFEYLPRLECAIICQDISQASLTKSVTDFICQNKHIKDNLIFAITKSDTKVSSSHAKIKEAVVKQLRDLKNSGVEIKDPKSRVVFTTTSGDNSELLSLIKDKFYKNYQSLKALKFSKNEEIFKPELIKILKDRAENISFSDSELDAKNTQINKEINTLNKNITIEKNRLDDFMPVIENNIETQLGTFMWR